METSQSEQPSVKTHFLRLGRMISYSVLGVLFGALTLFFLNKVTDWGHRIPSDSMSRDYFVAVLWALGAGAVIYFSPFFMRHRVALLQLWFVRCLVTLGFMLLYENHYGLDAYHYFYLSKQSFVDWSAVEFGRGSANVAALSWLMNQYLPIFDSYHALKVCYSLIGFIGIYIFYRAFTLYLGRDIPKLLYFLGLFPSMLFWSSILGKDPIVILGIGIYTYGVISWIKGKGYSSFLWVAAGVLLAGWIRIWLLLILMVPLSTILFSTARTKLSKAMVVLLVGAGTALSFQSLSTYFNFESAEELVVGTQKLSRGWSRGGSAQQVDEFNSLGDMVKFAPKGMFTALFRPLPGEVLNPFGLLAGLENLFVLILFFLACRKVKLSQIRKDPILTWGVGLVLVWSFMYGFVSYQNLGSAVRFKLQILPILVALIFYVLKKEELRTSEYV